MKALPAIAWGSDGLVPVIIVDDRTNAVLTLAYANREALDRTVATRSTWLFSRSRGELWNKGATSGNTQQVVAVAVDCDADALVYRVIPHGPACHTGSASCFERSVQLDRDAGAAFAVPDRAVNRRADERVAEVEEFVRGANVAADDGASEVDAVDRGADIIADDRVAEVTALERGADFAAAMTGLAATIARRKRAPVTDSYTAKLFAGGVDRIGKKIGEEATEVVIAAKNADRNELIWETADLLYHTLVLLAVCEIALDEVGAELTRRALPKT